MPVLTSYHVHSNISDGKNTIREFAEAAVRAGIDELGISDHYVLLASGRRICWSMPLDGLPTYFDDLRAADEEFKGKLVLRYGLEADHDPEAAAELGEILRSYPFDYVIGSVHFIDGFSVDERKENWDALTEPERNDMVRTYWDRITRLARSGLYDFVGHLDLYKKFGLQPSVDVSEEITTALDAIAESEMAIEINTAGWSMELIREAYPSASILSGCYRRGIPIVITSDAHVTDTLTRNFERAFALARSVGYSEAITFNQRRKHRVRMSKS